MNKMYIVGIGLLGICAILVFVGLDNIINNSIRKDANTVWEGELLDYNISDTSTWFKYLDHNLIEFDTLNNKNSVIVKVLSGRYEVFRDLNIGDYYYFHLYCNIARFGDAELLTVSDPELIYIADVNNTIIWEQ